MAPPPAGATLCTPPLVQEWEPSGVHGRTFNDPIHGHFDLSASTVAILDTPEFQVCCAGGRRQAAAGGRAVGRVLLFFCGGGAPAAVAHTTKTRKTPTPRTHKTNQQTKRS
jgi:hypothetical protein